MVCFLIESFESNLDGCLDVVESLLSGACLKSLARTTVVDDDVLGVELLRAESVSLVGIEDVVDKVLYRVDLSLIGSEAGSELCKRAHLASRKFSS